MAALTTHSKKLWASSHVLEFIEKAAESHKSLGRNLSKGLILNFELIVLSTVTLHMYWETVSLVHIFP